MDWRIWNKMFAMSLALAAAGILVCGVAVLDVVVPQGSILGKLGWLAVVVTAIAVVVPGYVWACEKCQDFLSNHSERRLRKVLGRPTVAGPAESLDAEAARSAPSNGKLRQKVARRFATLRNTPGNPMRLRAER